MLQYWVIKCQEGVVSIDQEIELLEGMAQMRDGPGRVAMQQGAKPPPPNRRPNPPIVITRDMIQVLCAGILVQLHLIKKWAYSYSPYSRCF